MRFKNMKPSVLLIIIVMFLTISCQQNTVGPDRGVNGCLTNEGYTFDSDVGVCTRNLALTDHEKDVIRNILMVQSYSSFTVVNVEKIANCQDCYDVTLQRNPIDEISSDEEFLKPYVIPYREGRIDYSYGQPITNYEECAAAGNPIMESYPEKCRDPVSGITFTRVIEDDWRNDGITLMKHEIDGNYGCFGCSTATNSPALCIDPVKEMKQVSETEELHCNSDFEVVGTSDEPISNDRDLSTTAICGNGVCEEGEADIEGGCGPDADPRCLGPPSFTGTCPTDCEFTECLPEQKNADACIEIYQPVCGKYVLNTGKAAYETFSNSCNACSSMKVIGYSSGACEDEQFVICDGSPALFDPEEYARDNNGVCVEACPDGFDPFTTQIGIQLCIAHYGESEIAQWDVCDRSSDSCRCVKAYETTEEMQIENPEYRCVPDKYADRLVFRAGIDSLDENGEQSVMIA
jgi:hypothetical protein